MGFPSIVLSPSPTPSFQGASRHTARQRRGHELATVEVHLSGGSGARAISSRGLEFVQHLDAIAQQVSVTINAPIAPVTLQVRAKTSPGLRRRLGEALRCPFCLDRVGRRDCVACGGATCGAVYHRDCWDEFRLQSATCAILGCEAETVREVSRLRYWFRFLRLLAAVVLFPPHLVRSVRRHQDDTVGTVFGLAWSKASGLARYWRGYWTKERSVWWLAPFILIGPGLIAASLLLTLTTPVLAFVATVAFTAARAVQGALQTEINALNHTASAAPPRAGPKKPTRPARSPTRARLPQAQKGPQPTRAGRGAG